MTYFVFFTSLVVFVYSFYHFTVPDLKDQVQGSVASTPLKKNLWDNFFFTSATGYDLKSTIFCSFF